MKEVNLFTYEVQRGETITLEVDAVGPSDTYLAVAEPFYPVSAVPGAQSRYRFQVDGSKEGVIAAAISAYFPPDSPESAMFKLSLIGSNGGDTSHFSISKTSAVKDITIFFIVDHPGIQPPEPWPHA